MSDRWHLVFTETGKNENNKWEIINFISMEIISLPENCTDEELLGLLKRRLYITSRAQLSQIRIDRQFQFAAPSSLERKQIRIYEYRNNRPLYYLTWEPFQ